MDKYSAIREVLRKHSSKEKPLKLKEIEEYLKDYGIKRHAISTALIDMDLKVVKDEFDYLDNRFEYMKKEGEVIYCQERNSRKSNYWIENSITDSELSMLIDMVLSSKMMTHKETNSLAERLLLLSGKDLDDNQKYRHRIKRQPYFDDEKNGSEKSSDILISNVAENAYIIRKAMSMKQPHKVKFTLNVYDYKDGKIFMRPYGKDERICSPYDLIMSNGRYYMLGADLETERNDSLKYKLYRVDLMTNLTITRAIATTREKAGINDTDDIYKYKIENPYMFTGETKRVRFRIDREQFTQVVDWFGKDFRVIGEDIDRDWWEIEVKVNTNSFLYWVLQYGGCVEVMDGASDNHFRNTVKLKLTDILHKYLESDIYENN